MMFFVGYFYCELLSVQSEKVIGKEISLFPSLPFLLVVFLLSLSPLSLYPSTTVLHFLFTVYRYTSLSCSRVDLIPF
jgi:hypothetical protein